MPKRYSFEEVYNYFESQGCKLLSKQYKNNKEKLKFICCCGTEHEMIFDSFKRGQRCPNCKSRTISKSITVKLDINEIKEQFKERDMELLEDTYKNTTTKMKYICNKHPETIQKISYEKFKYNRGCRFCGNKKKNLARTETIDNIKVEFKNRSYQLLTTKYKNTSQQLKFLCPKHGEQKITLRNFRSGQGCRECGIESRSLQRRGELNHNWQGGITTLNHRLREMLNQWKREVLVNHKFTCFVSGKKERKLQVHHTKSFSELRDEVLKDLGFGDFKHIGEVTDEEMLVIEKEFMTRHKKLIGIPIRKDLHQLFHREYGFVATMDNLYQFKERYLKGEFEEIDNKNEQLKLII